MEGVDEVEGAVWDIFARLCEFGFLCKKTQRDEFENWSNHDVAVTWIFRSISCRKKKYARFKMLYSTCCAFKWITDSNRKSFRR